jgi:hypothetical protein
MEKVMNKLTFYIPLLLCLYASLAQAQPRVVEKTFRLDGSRNIDLNLRFGDHIKISSWDKDEVAFRAVIEINGGHLNDALVLNYTEDQSGLSILADYNEERLKDGRQVDCSDERYSSFSWNNGDGHVVCSEITYELKVPRRADLEVESISADIELLGLAGPVHAKSISGFVDLSWPDRWGAELSLKTISGEAYSNLDDLEFLNKKEHTPLVGYELRGKIGGGGPLVHLESISGDIYLRKQ